MLPGVERLITDRRPSRFAPPSHANWFTIGTSQRGPIDEPILITSMTQKEVLLGPRTTETQMFHDSLEAFFRIGGRNAYVGRLVGPAAATAGVDIDDTDSGDAFVVEATSPGEWANDIDVIVTTPTTDIKVAIEYDGSLVEESPLLASKEEVIAWVNTTSNYVRFTDGGGDGPDADTYSLTGGADDLNNINDDTIEAALNLFTSELGPGRVSAPGMTSSSTKQAVAAHCEETVRIGLLDSVNGGSLETIASNARNMRSQPGSRFCGEFWPYAVIPGVAIGTERVVPYSAIQAGLTAAAMGKGATAGDPIAGLLGETDYVLRLTQDTPSDADRELLNDAGVNVAIMYREAARTYGNRTYAHPLLDENWTQLSQSSTVSAVSSVAEEVAQDYYQKKIDGRGFTLADYAQELAGRACLPFYETDDLYGETPGEAFQVNVGPDVNTPESLASGELRAVLLLRTSPGGDLVRIEIVKVPTVESL